MEEKKIKNNQDTPKEYQNKERGCVLPDIKTYYV